MGKLSLTIIILTALFATACGMDRPDRIRRGINDSQLSEGFRAAREVMKERRCFECHGWQNAYEPDFISAGLIVPGNAANSLLYSQLRGVRGTMPMDNAPLTADQIGIIRDWIDGIQSE